MRENMRKILEETLRCLWEMTTERTDYWRTVTIRDGYQGHTQPLHLCRSPSGTVWGVHTSGYITWEDPKQGIPPLHVEPVNP